MSEADGPRLELLYVAMGFDYLVMAANSAATATANSPGVRPVVITNVDVPDEALALYFARIVRTDLPSEQNRALKTGVIDYAESPVAAYLDCDTEVISPLDPILPLLERFDVAVVMEPTPASKKFEVGPGVSSVDFPWFNGGVLFFRNDAPAARFFATWNQILVTEQRSRDQPSLAQAVYLHPEVRVLPLNVRWNFTPHHKMLLTPKPHQRFEPIISHYRKPHMLPEVAARLKPIAEHLHSALPAGSDHQALARRAVSKYRVLGSPAYSRRLLRWVLVAASIRWRRLRGLPPLDLHDRGAVASGESYERIETES